MDVVCWLCTQVEPTVLSQVRTLQPACTLAVSCCGVSSMRAGCARPQEPAPLSQGVLLALLQQLGYDLSREPVTKLTWIRDAALALDPQVRDGSELTAVLQGLLMCHSFT